MDFISFLILLVISVAVSAILHRVLKFYVMPGLASYCGKIIVGWFGRLVGFPRAGPLVRRCELQ